LDYLLGMGFFNRPDLLYKALESIPSYWTNTLVIDNSENQALRKVTWLHDRVSVMEPPVPFTFPQMINYLREQGEARGCDFILYMHNDAEAHPGTPEAFLNVLNDLLAKGRKWGAAFTNYDILLALHLKAMAKIGPWDTTFTQYCSDTDYYWRLKSAGYELVWTGLGVTHHNGGSNTVKSDPYRKHLQRVTSPHLYEPYFVRKWGRTWRSPGDLAFNKPWYKVPFCSKGGQAKAKHHPAL
jgi:hypothetical protein